MNYNSPPPVPKLGTPAGNAGGYPVLQIPGSSSSSSQFTQLQPSLVSNNATKLNTTAHRSNSSTSLSDLLSNNNTKRQQSTDRNSPSNVSETNQHSNGSNNNDPSMMSPSARKPPATLTSQSMDRINSNNSNTAASVEGITDLRQYPLHSGSLHEAMNSMLRALIAISEEQKTLKESVQFTESSAKALNQKVLNEIAEVNREFVQNLVRKKDWSDARFDDHRKVEHIARLVNDISHNLNTEDGTIVPRIQNMEKQHETFKKSIENDLKKVVKSDFFDTELETVRARLAEMTQAMDELGKEMKRTSLEDLENFQEEYAGTIKSTHATLVQRIEQLAMNQQAFELKISQSMDSMKQNLQTVADRVAVLEVDAKSDRDKAKSAVDDLTAEVRKHDDLFTRWKKSHEERFTSFHNAAFLRLARLESGAEESGRAQMVSSRELTQVQSALAEFNGDLSELQTKLSTDEGSLRKLIEDVSKRVSESEAYTKQKIDTQSEDWRSTKSELDKRLKSAVQEATEASAAVWKQQQRNESAWQESIATNIELKLRNDFAKSLSEADETVAKLRSQLLRVDETQHVVINDLRTLNRDLSGQQNQMDNVVESLSTLESSRAKEFQKTAQTERHFRQSLQELFDLVNAESTSRRYGNNDNRTTTEQMLMLPPFTSKNNAADDEDGTEYGNNLNSISALQEPIDKSLLEPVSLHTAEDGTMSLTPRSKQRQNHQNRSNPSSLVNSRYTSPTATTTTPRRQKELTRDGIVDPALENLQVFRHEPRLRSPPRRLEDNNKANTAASADQDVTTNDEPPLFSNKVNSDPSSSRYRQERQQQILNSPQQQQQRASSLTQSNNNNNDNNSVTTNSFSNLRSGSALIIPPGLPKLGLEVANRKNALGGVVVLGVSTHQPAYVAGLCRGDIIVSLSDYEIRTKQDFVDALQGIVDARPSGERVVNIDVSYVAVAVEGEFDASAVGEIPDNRKRKTQMTASVSV